MYAIGKRIVRLCHRLKNSVQSLTFHRALKYSHACVRSSLKLWGFKGWRNATVSWFHRGNERAIGRLRGLVRSILLLFDVIGVTYFSFKERKTLPFREYTRLFNGGPPRFHVLSKYIPISANHWFPTTAN